MIIFHIKLLLFKWLCIICNAIERKTPCMSEIRYMCLFTANVIIKRNKVLLIHCEVNTPNRLHVLWNTTLPDEVLIRKQDLPLILTQCQGRSECKVRTENSFQEEALSLGFLCSFHADLSK